MRVIGAPFNSAGVPDGVAAAPRALRERGLISALSAAGSATSEVDPPGAAPAGLVDAGDVDTGPPVRERDSRSRLLNLSALTTTTDALRHAVADTLLAGDLPLVLGGDCPVLLGCLRAAQDLNASVGLLFVDGHEDAWPPAVSTTGEAADSELGLALGAHRADLPPELVLGLPSLDSAAVVALGPRDADELAEHSVRSLADTITMRGPGQISADPVAEAASATRRILQVVDSWWLHIDLDVLSTEALPAVDYPQPGGISWSDLNALTRTALTAPGCVGITLCIYNPDLDPTRRHADQIVSFAGALAPTASRR
ncbi:MAG TPA: arginase family protein [Pseudonocardia sp.]|uniref:arginase family protein n=1 Tax=Pseudonocardia sp. TaxID=60912 RepID=UPI002BEDCF35|nr:arginase family protein [Pseudonocardia sp.]HTF53324.1 arginase family protein [Pseudonocardia sp.]